MWLGWIEKRWGFRLLTVTYLHVEYNWIGLQRIGS